MATVTGKYFLKPFASGATLPSASSVLTESLNYTIYAYPFSGATVTGSVACSQMRLQTDGSMNFYRTSTGTWHNLRNILGSVYHFERIIDFGTGNQTVTDNFYNYFIQSAIALTGENTLQGRYRLKSNLSLTNGVYFEYESGKYLVIGMTRGESVTQYLTSTAYTFIGGTLTALSSGDIIEITEPITISDYELQVFNSAFEKALTLTYDLTKLNLNDGTYSITVRANAEGYKSAVSNAVSYVVEAPKVKLAAGTYVANDSINIPPSNDNALNFTSNGTSFTSVNVSNRQDDGYRTDDSYLRYGTTNVFWFYDWHEGIDVYEWVNTAYKTITLDTDQEVSSDFATWFNANFSVAPSGIQVTVENTGDSYVEVYDAQTRTNLVGELNDYESGTYTITSGYVYLLGWNFSHVSTTGGVTVKTNTTCYNDLMYYAVYTVTGNGTITCTTCKCFAEGTQISLADGSTKAVEDITMSDNLLVWDFYEGKQSSAKPMWIMPKKEANYYFKVTLSDNTVLNLVGYKINGGSRSHRLYNVKQNAFLYPQDFAEGEHTINEYGELLTINSIECIEETVNYYNIITDTHYNLYAENILTSCRLSNRYGIVDMKYDKNDVRMTEDEVEAYIDNLDAV